MAPPAAGPSGLGIGGQHVPALDGVRGLAILVILFHNTSWIAEDRSTGVQKLVGSLAAAGWVGVTLFFVLSGLLITGILLDTRDRPHFFRSFYIRRTLRIFPIYYLLLATVVLIGPRVIHDQAWVTSVREHQIYYWTYVSNWVGKGIVGLSHFWSLAVEEQFYLAWPLVVWLVPRRRLPWVCGAIILVTPIIRLGLYQLGLVQATYSYTVARWDALAFGAGLAILVRSEAGRRWLARFSVRIGVGALAVLLGFVLLHRGFHTGNFLVDVWGHTVVAVFFAALLSAAVVPSSRVASGVRRAFETRWIRFLGKYSYAIYVFHEPIYHIAKFYLAGWVNQGGGTERVVRLFGFDALILATATAIALLSWHLIEKHCLRLKDRWTVGTAARVEAAS